MTLVAFLIDNNFPWRIMGKRRDLTKEIDSYLDGIYVRMRGFTSYNGTHNPFIELMENNISLYHDKYWNVSKYQKLFSDFKNNLYEPAAELKKTFE